MATARSKGKSTCPDKSFSIDAELSSLNSKPGCIKVVDTFRVLESCPKTARARWSPSPVSYTHLDVYKRQGLYSSTLSEWRRQRDAGAFSALVPGKRGPRTAEPNPLSAEVAALQRNNARLTQRLARAEAVIDIQKKVAALLGIPLAVSYTHLDVYKRQDAE